MNAPFSPDKQPLLSLDSGVLGDKFKELSKLPGFSQHYGDLARESLETFQARMDLASVDFSNYELAVTQLDGLRDFEWGGLDFIVRLYMPLHVRDGIKMPKKQLEASLDIACDEKTIKGHKKLIRRFLEGPSAKKVGLQELANDYFNPKSQEKKNSDYRDKLRDDVLPHMADIGLWQWIENTKVSERTKVSFHAGFEITAGPVLKDYQAQVWLPYTELLANAQAALRQHHFPSPPPDQQEK
jgi:hypothetical protein